MTYEDWLDIFSKLERDKNMVVEKPRRTKVEDLTEGWYPVRYLDSSPYARANGWFVVYLAGKAPFFQFDQFVDLDRPLEFGPRIEMPSE